MGEGRGAAAAEVEVELPTWWLHEHRARLAERRVRWYRGRDVPSGHRPVVGDEVGLKGEAATLLWLKGNGFRLGEDREMPWAEVLAGKPGPPWLRIDVESWPTPDWRRLGTHVASWRLARVLGHAWLVVWASVEGAVVTLRGWTTAADVLADGVAEWTAGVHANVRVPAGRLRAMDVLAGAGPALSGIVRARPDAGCGHRTSLGFCWACAHAPAGGAVLPPEVEVLGRRFHAVGGSAHRGWRPGQGRRMRLADAVLVRGSCLECFPLVW